MEVLIAASIFSLVVAAVTAILSQSVRVEQVVVLQGAADRSAVAAMNHIIVDAREAKEVSVLAPYRFRIFYPVVMADGHFDRFRPDYAHYIEYTQSDASGIPSPTGKYIWRSTDVDRGRALADDVRQLAVIQDTPRSLRVTIEVTKSASGKAVSTNLTGRVLYLRNN